MKTKNGVKAGERERERDDNDAYFTPARQPQRGLSAPGVPGCLDGAAMPLGTRPPSQRRPQYAANSMR